MKNLTLFCSFFFSFQVLGETRSYRHANQIYQLHRHQNLWVSLNCQADCLALTPPKLKESAQGIYAGNPAAEFCLSAQGEYIIVKDLAGFSEGLCQFKDKSYILVWDFYRKFKTK